MRTLLRFSAAVAFSRDRRQRWRQISVAGAAALAAALLLVALALVDLAERSPARAGAMLGTTTAADEEGVPGASPEGAVAVESGLATVAGGRQVPTAWIEPMPGHEDDPAAVPTGLERLPAPGEAVLSPALVDAGYTAEDFGWTSSSAGSGPGGTIGPEGLGAASEPLIYVRPVVAGVLHASGSGTYIADYTRPDPGRTHGGRAMDPEVVEVGVMVPGVLRFLVTPALALLVSGARARSPVRDDRLRLLVRLGVRTGRARAAMAAEVGLLALVGAVLGTLVMLLLGRFLTVVPGTSIRLFPGDLVPPWWGVPLVVLLVAAVATGGGALGRITRQGRSPRLRAHHGAAVVGLLFALGVVVVSAWKEIPRDDATILYAGGALGAIALFPAALPVVVAAASATLRSARPPVLWAAGRRLRREAVHLSRVASVLGVLIMVLGLAVALWANAMAVGREASPVDDERVLRITWTGDPESGLATAREAFAAEGREALVLITVGQDPGPDGEPRPSLVVVDDCPALVTFFDGDEGALCAPGAGPELAVFVRERTGMEVAEGRRSPAAGEPTGAGATVFAAADLSTSDAQRILGDLPVLSIDARAWDFPAPLPIVQWIAAGGFAALAIIGLAVLREVGDRSVEDAERDALYQRVSLSLATTERLAAAVLMVPLAIAAVLAFGCTVVLAYSGEVLDITEGDTLRVALVALVALAAPVGMLLLAAPVRRAAAVLAR